MEIEDLEFNINEFEEDESFFKVTDDLEGQVIREVEPLTQKHKYCCYLWNSSCARSICLGFDLDEHQLDDIITTLTY